MLLDKHIHMIAAFDDSQAEDNIANLLPTITHFVSQPLL
jgi:hypothetical protein